MHQKKNKNKKDFNKLTMDELFNKKENESTNQDDS